MAASGRPFQKGESGNPSGRSKIAKDIAELAKLHSVEALERLVFWMRAGSAQVSVIAAKAIVAKVLPDLKAVEHSGEINHFHGMADAELDQRIRQLSAQIGIDYAPSGEKATH